MADERCMLGALERMRLHTAGDRDSRSASTYDGIESRLHVVTASTDTTPSRRKSSALTLSHLAAASPLPPATNETPPPRGTLMASQAVRDLSRELDAVESRLSVFRQRRETSDVTTQQPSMDTTSPVVQDPLQEQQPKATHGTPSISPKEHPPQQAGEVAEEVEHALANCDRLLQHAKLQASAASLTRSLRGSSSSHLQAPPLASAASTGRRPRDQNTTQSATRHNPEPRDNSLNAEEMALEATARTMRALVARREAEIERQADEIVAQNQTTQTRQLQELQRKFESKKKMVLLTLREQCENETRSLVKQTMFAHDQAEQEAVKKVEEKLLSERQRVLDDLLLQHQQDTEDHVQRVHVRVQGETFAKKQQLEKRLQQEFQDQLQQIDHDAAQELQRWEQKQRLSMEKDLLTRREQAAEAVLRAQEAKTNELKQQLQQQQSANERDELEKLKKALAFGAQAQLQQLRKKMANDHENHMNDTRTEAALAIETKLVDLKQVLTLAHKQELDKLERDLEKRHRVAVMETHEQLEKEHRTRVEELSTVAAKELDQALAALRKTLETQNQCKLAALEQTVDRDHRVRLQQLEMDLEEQCERELQQLRRKLIESQQRELEAKLARMKQSKAALLDEAVCYLTIKPDDRHHATSGGGGGGTTTTEALVHLKQLTAQLSLPQQLQRAVAMLVRDFEELTEEQTVLVEKIGDCTGLYLTFKRQCVQMECEVDALREALETLHAQLQTKDALAKKLYMANEALLAKLGLSD